MSAGDARDQAVAWRLAWTQASGGGAEAGAVGGASASGSGGRRHAVGCSNISGVGRQTRATTAFERVA
jgi:hypothetical protein